jgi:OOP family OmpA-OmpF porin
MLKKIVAAAALAMLASSSFAGTPGTVYGGLDVGSTKLDGNSDSQASFGGFVGYNFHQNFAVEGGFRRLGTWDNGGPDVTVDQTAVSVIGTLPLNQGFNVYGRLGYNYVKVDRSYGDASESGTLYGVGVGYTFSPKLAGRIEVQKPTSDSTNVGASVVYQF